MGTRVCVTVISEEPRGVLATFEGDLWAGGEIQSVSYPAGNEAFVFGLGREGTASFVLESRMLRRAVVIESGDEGPDSLRFYLGVTTVVQVDPIE